MRSRAEQRFYFALARELKMPVSRMLEEMDSQEICDWMAFFALEEEDRKKPKQENDEQLANKIKTSLGYMKHGKQKSR